MNIIFTYLFIIATAILLFINPDLFLKSVLSGASKGATLCLALVSSYAIWLGLIRVWEESGISKKISKLLSPLVKRVFKTKDEETACAISMNLSINLLGMGGAATPYGIKACQLLDKTDFAEYASAMFFVINATSIQLLPTAIVGVRASLGSISPADIILPSILTSAFSTFLGISLTMLYFKIISRTRQVNSARLIPLKKLKMNGAGTR
ncbi:MAG: nucleoside recognition protein [Clostridia bacterium]|nr:nucleoside recognition protein [Clostridia bacterium]